jgi:type I restriction enzyme R subunit
VEAEQWDQAIIYLKENVLDKPNKFFTLEKLRKAAGVDRRLGIRELLEKAFGLIPGFKSKNDILEEEFQKFILDHHPDCPEAIMAMKYYFKAYATDASLREIIDNKDFGALNVNPTLGMAAYKEVPPEWRSKIPEYVKDYVSLNQFM